MVDQYYYWKRQGGMFWLQQVLLDIFFFIFFQHDLVTQFGSEQDWSAGPSALQVIWKR